MPDSGNERPALRKLTRDLTGFFQPDPVVPWLGLHCCRQCKWKHLELPETNVRADVGMLLNRGDSGGYEVRIHYVGARFFAADKVATGSPVSEQGRMVGAVLAPHHGQVPAEESFYCACDSIDEDNTQLARVLLDQYSIEELFNWGRLLVVVEHEFVKSWMSARQQAAMRLVIDHLAQRWKRLR
jgi:hypothetical protein